VSIYRPTYIDKDTRKKHEQATLVRFHLPRGAFRDSTNTTSKTLARVVEQNKRREVMNATRALSNNSIRAIKALGEKYFESLSSGIPTRSSSLIMRFDRLSAC
jgi:hypothetical protein